MSYRNMFRCGLQCCNGVRWKCSTQNFERHLFSGTAARRRQILDGTWEPSGCAHFTICERGKTRPIDAPHIVDRQIHKTFARKVLWPVYTPSLIRDNAASLPGRGLHWQIDRLRELLHRHWRRHGREGAVLLLDLKGYFPNANRQIIHDRHARLLWDTDVRELADHIVESAPATGPGRGMPLGLEISQLEMISLPTDIDQWLKSQMGLKAAGHYMDDYFVIHEDERELRRIGNELVRRFRAAGIPVNLKKCRVVPLTKPFKFCKARFMLTGTGRVIVNRCRDGMKRARRKLKMFRREYGEGRRSMEEIDQFMECQLAYYREYNDHGRVLRLSRLRHALFEETQ